MAIASSGERYRRGFRHAGETGRSLLYHIGTIPKQGAWSQLCRRCCFGAAINPMPPLRELAFGDVIARRACLESHPSMIKRTAIVFALLTFLPMERTSADQRKPDLEGWWTWNEHGASLHEFKRQYGKQAAFSLLFRKDGTLDAATFMPDGLGKGAGEGLSSSGRYRLVRNRLIITREHKPADGWPSRDGNPPYRYSCSIALSQDAKSFRLDKCPISGTWLRDDNQ